MTKNSILIVDDDSRQLELFQRLLEPELFNLLYTPDAVNARWIAEKELPDIIIMDWVMPRLSGLDALKLIRANRHTKQIPVLIATAKMTDSVHLKLALESGATDFVRKPFDRIELLARVHAALKLNDSQRLVKEQQIHIQIQTQRERLQLQEKLNIKQNELSAQSLFEKKYQQLFFGLHHDLKSLRQELNGHTVPALNRLEKRVKQGLNAQNESKNFLYYFKKVDPAFFKSIDRLGVRLTKQDVKYCAYLKLNLNYKEIANMHGVEVDSVKRHMNRLRKKLGLNQTQDIRRYVNAL